MLTLHGKSTDMWHSCVAALKAGVEDANLKSCAVFFQQSFSQCTFILSPEKLVSLVANIQQRHAQRISYINKDKLTWSCNNVIS